MLHWGTTLLLQTIKTTLLLTLLTVLDTPEHLPHVSAVLRNARGIVVEPVESNLRMRLLRVIDEGTFKFGIAFLRFFLLISTFKA